MTCSCVQYFRYDPTFRITYFLSGLRTALRTKTLVIF